MSQPADSQAERSELKPDDAADKGLNWVSDSPSDASEPDYDSDAASVFTDNEFSAHQRFDRSRVEGDVNGTAIYNSILNIGQAPSKRSLYADTYDLPEAYADLPEFIREAPTAHLAKLQQDHLLAIGCEDPKVALSAAQMLVHDLRITKSEYRRLYKVREKIDEDMNVRVKSFFPELRNRANKAVVVVDAFDGSGHAFISSLMNDLTAPHWLKDNSAYLLFIVNPACIDEPFVDEGRSSEVPKWKISCLHNLLRSGFPEQFDYYKQKIIEQQAAGWWYEDQIKLYYEVKGHIEKNRLPDEIELREKPPLKRLRPETIFRDDQHIEKNVLYVATYFRDVALSEFCELVEALLGGREVLATIPEITCDDNQTTVWSHAPKVRSLVDIWNDSKDRFIWNERFRKTISTGEMVISIDFADYSIRASLRDYLAKERKFFLRDQFNVLQRKGFFFHPSGRIGERIVSLTAEMAVDCPDEYDNEWLVGIIKSLRDHAQPGSVGNEQDESLCFLPANRPSWGYSRVSELLRQLMKTSQTRDMVNRCLSDLMRLEYYDAVLNLIRRLRFAPDFDRLHWLKQLFDRGDPSIRIQAFNHLYDSVREESVSIYETLNKLESWFPQDDRDVGKYPQSARFALRLLIKYCFETIYRFSQEFHGSPSGNYILFNFSDQDVAKANLDQLVRWLRHPAIVRILHESLGLEKKPIRLLGVLMVEWAVILGGLAETSLIEATNETRDTQSVSAIDVLELLIERVASSTSNDEQRDLMTFWEESNRVLLRSMSNPRLAREKRDQLAVSWNRVFSLTQEFRKMHVTAKAS